MKQLARLVFVGAIVFWIGAAHAATEDEKCYAGRAKAAGKYAACVQNVMSKEYGKSGLFSLEAWQKLTKCRLKYVAVWDKLHKLSGSALCNGVRFGDLGTAVQDNLTGLIWEKKTTTPGSGVNAADRHDVDNAYVFSSNDGDLTDEDGSIYSDFLANSNTGFGGANGWRLPSVAELLTILLPEELPCTTHPCISATFGPTQTSSYMTQTTAADDTTTAFLVSFHDGSIAAISKGLPDHFVRAVRGGL